MCVKKLGWGSFDAAATGNAFLTQSPAIHPLSGAGHRGHGRDGNPEGTADCTPCPPSPSFSPPRSWAQGLRFSPRPCALLGGLSWPSGKRTEEPE